MNADGRGPAAVRFDGASKSYGDRLALRPLVLRVEPGEVFALVGPNGAGKTTTISILCGLFPPTEGTVLIDGMDLSSDLDRIKQLIGVIPQDLALYPTLSARENLTFYGNMYGIRGKVLHDRIDDFLNIFGLEKFSHRLIGK